AAARARDGLTQQLQALRSELEQQRQASNAALAEVAVWAEWGGLGSGEDAASVGAASQRLQMELDATRQQYTRERAAWHAELNRLREENNQLRRWLGSKGIQFLQVPTNPNPS